MSPTNTENPPLKVVLKIFRNLPNSSQKICRHEEEDGSTHKTLAPSKLIGKEQLHILLVLLFFNVYASWCCHYLFFVSLLKILASPFT